MPSIPPASPLKTAPPNSNNDDDNDKSSSSSSKDHVFVLQTMPLELQVRILSYLRAIDLSCVQQVNRYFAYNQKLHHSIVVYCSTMVYPKKWTIGFQDQPTTTTTTATSGDSDIAGKRRSESLGSLEESKPPPTSGEGRQSRSSSLGSLEESQTASAATSTTTSSDTNPTTTAATAAPPYYYTFEHLRNMELLVVARVLNSPEPATGFVVSKSWCKSALAWLEGQQERRLLQQEEAADANNGNKNKNGQPSSKKKKKRAKKKTKQQRLKQRKAGNSNNNDTSTRPSSNSNSRGGCGSCCSAPPPNKNINSDITCEHDQLQCYTSTRSARARRRLLDRQAWKILKTLYPESTPLPLSKGECLQCRLAKCQVEKEHRKDAEVAKQERKLPLKDPSVRRFYTRTRGVPEHCLRDRQQQQQQNKPVGQLEFSEHSATSLESEEYSNDGDCKISSQHDDDDRKMPALQQEPHLCHSACPLVDGTYYVLPRAWCHGWRRFIKTGEGGNGGGKTFLPPDAASLLCDAHRLALLPPHLESFLYGESSLLLGSSVDRISNNTPPVPCTSVVASLPPGQGPTQESIQAMRSLGLNEGEISRQLSAMRTIEAQQQRIQREANVAAAEEAAAAAASSPSALSRNELLDRENHSVVEILSQHEFRALEACWPGTTVFALHFTVRGGGDVDFATPVCRSCDASGRQCSMSIKNRARGWVKRNSERARAPASLEY